MNISKLFEMQRNLLHRIVEDKKLVVDELTADTFMALQVELAEFANEGRWFKYWSNNKKPNTREYLTNYTEQDSVLGPGAVWRNPLLEEFVDGVHFFLQIAILKGWEDALYIFEEQLDPDHFGDDENISEWYMEMTYFLNKSYFENPDDVQSKKWEKNFGFPEKQYHFRVAWILFLNIGVNGYGLTLDQIEQAYMDKNATNHTRQDNSY